MYTNITIHASICQNVVLEKRSNIPAICLVRSTAIPPLSGQRDEGAGVGPCQSSGALLNPIPHT